MNKHHIKSHATKQKIINTYLELLREKEISEITIQEIVSRVSCNRGTFYIHYRSIYDLHRQIKQDFTSTIKTQVQAFFDGHSDIQLETFSRKFADIFIQNEKYFVPLITHDNSFSSDVKNIIKPLANQYFPERSNRADFDYILEYHLSSVFAVVRLWIARDKDIKADKLFSLLQQIVTRGVFTVLAS